MQIKLNDHTIAAISTPLGSGGIGIVRLSGAQSLQVAQKLFRPYGKKKLEEMEGYSACLGRIFDENGDMDEAICTVYHAPKSYTGEDVVELSCHGGIWLVQAVLRRVLACGAQAAQPGEFTKRAFLNGKMNLSQAEAVMDLIEAQGQAAMRAAISERDGALSSRINEIVEKLVAESAHLAAWTDYPEEDIADVDETVLLSTLQNIIQQLSQLLQTFDQGRILRVGIQTAIVGKPNVGKSTLMNVLAGAQRSIVTDVPGTTRDVVEETVQLGDFLLRLADTAGIREADDIVESIGVERARKEIEQADLILAVFDSSRELDEADFSLLSTLKGRTCIAVINKVDLPSRLEEETIRNVIPRFVTVSAQRGEGRQELEQAIRDVLQLDKIDLSAGIVANERQRDCLQNANRALRDAVEALELGLTLDAVNVCIDYALNALLELSGKRASEEVVDAVFAQFCVGK